jgi:acyl carrier protein
VSILQLDCSDPVAVRDCTNLGDLTNVVGVFHLAGVLEDALVTNLTRSALTKVVAPKAAGALALLTRAETLGWDLDFWVNFSSSSSLLGYAGQSNYCAANSVLDHLAMFPSADARSPPMLTINWGPWGEAGMAAPGTKAYSQAIAEGDRPLSNTTALAHLGQALSAFESSQASGRQFLITDVDWSRSPWASSTVVPQCQPQSAPAQSVKSVSPGIRSDVQSMPDDNASAVAGMSPDVSTTTRTSIVDLLKQMVPTWNTKVTLPEAGLDSLDVVQIRNAVMKELHIKVPLSVFNKPNQTLGGLVDVLEKAASV